MGKIIKKLAITFIIIFMNFPLALAAAPEYTAPDAGKIFPNPSTLTPPFQFDTTSSQVLDAIKVVGKLPRSNPTDIINTAVRTVLSFSMILTLIALIVAAIYYLISNGDESKTSKAKHIILYLLIGMAIIAGSLGIITGITQFKFLE